MRGAREPPHHPGTPLVGVGDTVRDEGTGRIGKGMGFVGPYAQLRPVGGGREWDARPERLMSVTRSAALSEGVARSNARSRGERL
ncbi:hypothetical protein [Streptomyces stelliscabiei]|uniref:Uncharacterized protein n=1 Tax=Streptomyces stelliscabiei TaxID=146820 RepID=A0A8I0TQ46_9ACTN|nr:hypothetical protein [Streptomyces stelliscabiei]MBE1597530.1 hypothetical protein [Streptomyces stelliscabiei]MDX2522145.1 hypothetical protein [Streptomyces stelliscabiei]